jgi:HAD superfamily hydrolase (TIGR01509 family)
MRSLHLRIDLGPLCFDGVVFDLDATLVNLGEHVDWRRAQEEVEKIYLSCGYGEEELKQRCMRGLFNLLNVMHEELAARRPKDEVTKIQGKAFDVIEAYEMRGVEACGLMPGCLDTLNWLRKRGTFMGICTSNSIVVAEKILDSCGLASYFSSVVGRRIDLKMKPNPDQIEVCLREMGVEPRRAVMVGDSHNDVLAGKAAGTFTVAIPVYFTRSETLNAAKPDAVIKSLHELPRALLDLVF